VAPGPDGTAPTVRQPRVPGARWPDAPLPQTDESAPRSWPPGPPEPRDVVPGRRRSRRTRKRRVLAAVLVAFLLQTAAVAGLNWIGLPQTRYMHDNPAGAIREWTDVEQVSRYFLVLAMGQEDQDLPTRIAAFDTGDFVDRVQAHAQGQPDDSGSTIPQQVVKNMFLTPGQTAVRKGIEAVLAQQMAFLVSDSRILEFYVNYAQFSPEVYGVCAASWYYFGHTSKEMSLDEAAQLVGLLPSPLHVHRGPAGGLQFHDPDGDGIVEPQEDGYISAENVWRAQALAARWFDQMGGFTATETLGIDGVAADQPARDGDCSAMPEDVAALIAREHGR
jgi:monofunctional biosynthetic peptidoglycan transglycosylase